MKLKHTAKIPLVIVMVIIMTLAFISWVFASPGDLDTTFDGDGIVTESFSGNPAVYKDIVIQPDNKIVVAGYTDQDANWSPPVDLLLARYLQDGSPDTTFATNGIYTGTVGGDNRFNGVTLQPDGKIIAVGYLTSGGYKAFLVARFNSDGTLDDTFGSAGIAYSSLSAGDDVAYAVAVQDDGKIIVAGSAEPTAYSFLYDFVVARYTTSGVLDTSFNTTGYSIVSLNSDSRDYAQDVAIQSDGKIVASGMRETGSWSNTYQMATIRLTETGVLDTSFNGTGIASFFGSTTAGMDGGLVIQNDGKIVVAANASSVDIGAIRYNIDGTVDTAFTTADFGSTDMAMDATIQADGKVVVTGYKNETGNSYDPVVVRYNTDGTLDTTFSGDGLAYTNIGTDSDYGLAVGMQPDGQILVAGYKVSGGNAGLILRYDTQVNGTETVGTSSTPVGDTNVSALVSSGSCDVTVTKQTAFPGGSPDAGEMPVVWDVSESGCTFPMTLQFCYTDDELTNAMTVTESSLVVFKYDTSGGTWSNLGGTVDTGTNCVSLSGVTELSTWTVGDITTSGNEGPTIVSVESLSGEARRIYPWLIAGSAGLLLVGIYQLHRRKKRIS